MSICSITHSWLSVILCDKSVTLWPQGSRSNLRSTSERRKVVANFYSEYKDFGKCLPWSTSSRWSPWFWKSFGHMRGQGRWRGWRAVDEEDLRHWRPGLVSQLWKVSITKPESLRGSWRTSSRCPSPPSWEASGRRVSLTHKSKSASVMLKKCDILMCTTEKWPILQNES